MTQTTHTPLEGRIKKFTGSLFALAVEGHEDRAALAALRSGLNNPQEAPRMARYVVPFLDEWPHTADRWFYVVGALFAWHPQRGGSGSLGRAFKTLRDREGASDSLEKRFIALLACDEDDLHGHLRQAVGLLRAGKTPVPVNWHRLLEDLTLPTKGWSHPDRIVQSQWARDFYHRPRQDAPDSGSASDPQ